MPRTRITALSASLLALASLAACGDDSDPFAPETLTTAEPMHSPVASLANTWSTVAPMPTKRRGLVAAAINTTIYAIGGQSFLVTGDPDDATEVSLTKVEAFNTGSGAWTTKASLPSARAFPSGAAVISGKIYVTGGLNASGAPTKTLYVYSPTTNTWASKAPIPVASARGAAVAIGGKLWVLTPAAGSIRLHRYDPATNTWVARASGPAGHHYPVAGVINGKIYVAGSMNSDQSPSYVTSVYDPATNTWAKAGEMPGAHIGAAGQVLGNKLYVVGGSHAFDIIEHGGVQSYDPAIGGWTNQPPASMPAQRTFSAGAVVNGKLYVLGGSKYPNVLGTNQVYTP